MSDGTCAGVERLRQADCGIGFDSHGLQQLEEPRALAGEEAVGGEARDCSHGACEPIGQRTNDRNMRELGAYEFARDWEDQAGLNQRIERVEEVWE